MTLFRLSVNRAAHATKIAETPTEVQNTEPSRPSESRLGRSGSPDVVVLDAFPVDGAVATSEGDEATAAAAWPALR